MNVLIPNATSPKNIGDLAMLLGLVSLFKKNTGLKIHSTEHKLYKDHLNIEVSPTLYSWAAFEEKSLFQRLTRINQLLINYFLFKNFKKTMFDDNLKRLIEDYKKADLIFFVGGGYLRSQQGITQSINLLMTLLLFQFAKAAAKKKIIAPMSFGPFAYKWQEKYAARILKDFDLVAAREQYSFDVLKKNKVNNLIRSSDTALFIKPEVGIGKKVNKNFTLGFTIRKWLSPFKQKKFEKDFLIAVKNFAKLNKATIQPIVQVDAPKYGDHDASLTEEIAEELQQAGVKVNPISKVKDIHKTAGVYGKIDLLLGMRMHSNILAAVHGTPFVAISYEYKTEGISKDLGLIDYCVRIEDADKNSILTNLTKAYKDIYLMKKKVAKSVEQIQIKEMSRWEKIIEENLSF